MHFRHHKTVLVILLLVELVLAANVDIERAYRLNLAMGVVYFGVVFWFIFGERQWWPYLFAGVAYITYIVSYRLLSVFDMVFDRVSYHLFLALLWGIILLIHTFVERHIGPPVAPPEKDHSKTITPDDD